MCVHIHASVYRGQKRMPDPLELESQATVSHQSQELGAELQPSAGAVSSLHCRAATLAPKGRTSNLTHAIFKFFWWQVRVSLHMEVPAVQLYNSSIFYLAQDLRNRLIGVALRTESEHRLLLSGSESHNQCHTKAIRSRS